MSDPLTFTVRVEQGHRRYIAWVEGSRDETEVAHPTREGAVSKLAETHLDDSESAGALE